MAAKHVPERTPKRWNLISTLVSDCTEGKHSPEVNPVWQREKQVILSWWFQECVRHHMRAISWHVGGSRWEGNASIKFIRWHKCTQAANTTATGQSVVQRLFATGHHFPWYTLQEERWLQQHLVLNADIVQRNTILATTRRCHREANIDSTTAPRMQSTFNSLLRQFLKLPFYKTSPTSPWVQHHLNPERRSIMRTFARWTKTGCRNWWLLAVIPQMRSIYGG